MLLSNCLPELEPYWVQREKEGHEESIPVLVQSIGRKGFDRVQMKGSIVFGGSKGFDSVRIHGLLVVKKK